MADSYLLPQEMETDTSNGPSTVNEWMKNKNKNAFNSISTAHVSHK